MQLRLKVELRKAFLEVKQQRVQEVRRQLGCGLEDGEAPLEHLIVDRALQLFQTPERVTVDLANAVIDCERGTVASPKMKELRSLQSATPVALELFVEPTKRRF